MKHRDHYEIYTDRAKKARWRFQSANGEITSAPVQSFASRHGAYRSIVAHFAAQLNLTRKRADRISHEDAEAMLAADHGAVQYETKKKKRKH